MDEREKLAAAAIAATAPDPKTWVQILQMTLAAIALFGALAAAGVLILHGPPNPKPATADVTEKMTTTKAGQEEEKVETTRSGPVGVSTSADAGTGGTSDAETDGTPSGSESETSSGGSEEGESLANLSKQGPWAFAIVLLLVAVFLATGKTLNVGGTKTGGPRT